MQCPIAHALLNTRVYNTYTVNGEAMLQQEGFRHGNFNVF